MGRPLVAESAGQQLHISLNLAFFPPMSFYAPPKKHSKTFRNNKDITTQRWFLFFNVFNFAQASAVHAELHRQPIFTAEWRRRYTN